MNMRCRIHSLYISRVCTVLVDKQEEVGLHGISTVLVDEQVVESLVGFALSF